MSTHADLQPVPKPPQPTSASSPDGRATDFQAVENAPEHYNGEKLVVGAYAFIWVAMMVWLGLMWKRQAGFAARIEGLERAIDRAESRLEGKGARGETEGPKKERAEASEARA